MLINTLAQADDSISETTLSDIGYSTASSLSNIQRSTAEDRTRATNRYQGRRNQRIRSRINELANLAGLPVEEVPPADTLSDIVNSHNSTLYWIFHDSKLMMAWRRFITMSEEQQNNLIEQWDREQKQRRMERFWKTSRISISPLISTRIKFLLVDLLDSGRMSLSTLKACEESLMNFFHWHFYHPQVDYQKQTEKFADKLALIAVCQWHGLKYRAAKGSKTVTVPANQAIDAPKNFLWTQLRDKLRIDDRTREITA